MKPATRNSGIRLNPGMIVFLGVVICLLGAPRSMGADWPQFRGLNRDGKSSETGLLKRWPKAGPPLVWSVENLGAGYTSVVTSGDLLYTTGLDGATGYIHAFHVDGKPAWKKPYGPDWSTNRPGVRTTPTINDGRLYLITGYGRVVCLDAATGDKIWDVDTVEIFGTRGVRWGIAESLLIEGDHVICTPGGTKGAIVALNRKTGKTNWVCNQPAERSGYCSPILIQRGDLRLIVTMTGKSLIGVDADTGRLLWQHARNPKYDIHAVSPVYEDGRIYTTSGYGGVRGLMVELSQDGRSITKKWTDKKLDCHHGGVIVLDGHVYGSSDRNSRGKWICLNLKTGEVVAEIRAVGKGSIAWADGMFYGYGESGEVGLINASPDDFRLVSSCKVTKGEKEHWAHPTIANGRLYIRHGSALMVYNIKADQ